MTHENAREWDRMMESTYKQCERDGIDKCLRLSRCLDITDALWLKKYGVKANWDDYSDNSKQAI